ncbi:MAG: hypothetical protein A2508_09390 [Candidatus Lambdaproteobacteria bacterium RIFOXYD12_FULL_49_8]|uniref:Phosphoribosyltransferase domain-containing protein n=1 Tax=Candidatus Lambdaproteobacteria bacterium RIFOXYD2_FULL_50_16 TaxID=1817772 RepID=A0A1F6GA31_9PROT|nr:MAG: hypothetical protein A2527_06425 [Candidatus Lambdaproteobacteria bacterium RIFOXYD2_FULL_50_16]OGG98359.1 MAG: hypothetical protein A2508_09390 [Candidatus Lambdaproteobacteria bacterium RIFOXYD12_FULL_49_8]
MSRFEHILFSPEQIQAQIRHLARLITYHYKGGPGPELVGLMNGSIVFMADLIRHLDLECPVQTMRVQSYQGTQAKAPEIELKFSVQGKKILVIDDILDSGQTLRLVCSTFKKAGAEEVKTCVLLDKKMAAFTPDFCAFACPDAWVVGYGMDYNGKYRNLPFIAELPPELR